MSLDWPATGQALWALSDATGGMLRPEYVIPVLWNESAFDPTIVNSIGCTGVNQQCPPNVPSGYASWSASQQISATAGPAWRADIAKYGPIRSGTKLYVANLYPAALAHASTLDSMVTNNASVLDANPGIDRGHKGYISVGDMGYLIAKAAALPQVQSAIAQAYALRPGESPHDPVLGEDYAVPGSSWRTVVGASLMIAAAAGAAYYIKTGRVPLLSRR